jgi:NAD(P)H-dependent flavin oxidoreductase YrpB (nitropropane dioxygenase family)
MNTRMIELCRIKHPFIQYGTHRLGRIRLAAVLVDVNCLDSITALTQPNPARAGEIARCRTRAGGPFGANLTFHPADPLADYPPYLKGIIEIGRKVAESAKNAVVCRIYRNISAAISGGHILFMEIGRTFHPFLEPV